jgi:hypothetical protein
MTFPILYLLAAQVVGSQETRPTWPAELSLSGSAAKLAENTYRGTQASGGAGASWFVGREMVDDGTPLALQAYLQRLNQLALSLGTGALWAGTANGYGRTDYKHSNTSVNGSVGGTFYLGDLVLGGGLSYERVADHQSGGTLTTEVNRTTQYKSASAMIGIRRGDTRLLGSYQWQAYNDDQQRPPTWGRASLDLRTVVDKNIRMILNGYTLVDGGGGSAQAEFFSSPELGLWMSGFFQTGQVYVNSTTDYNRVGVSFGMGWWPSHRFELQFEPGFTSAQQRSASSIALTTYYLNVTMVVRAPQHFRTVTVAPPAPADDSDTVAPEGTAAPDVLHDAFWP